MNLVVRLRVCAAVLIGLSPGLYGRGCSGGGPSRRGVVLLPVVILLNWKCSAINVFCIQLLILTNSEMLDNILVNL